MIVLSPLSFFSEEFEDEAVEPPIDLVSSDTACVAGKEMCGATGDGEGVDRRSFCSACLVISSDAAPSVSFSLRNVRFMSGNASARWVQIGSISDTKVSSLKLILMDGTLLKLISFLDESICMYLGPSIFALSFAGKSDCSTELRAISQMSAEANFQTCAATEYSSMSGSLV